MAIPQANPKASYLTHQRAINEAIQRVLHSGWYILGQEVRAFEDEFAAYIGVNHAIGVGSGTEALHLALRAANIGPGDEVITVSHTAVATVSAIEMTGAIPVFVDVLPTSYTLDVSHLEQAITPHTKAVLPVHIYGQAADMAEILAVAHKHNLLVIEDCAQSAGASYQGRRTGAWGSMGCFSFYPTKNLGALGDGGMVVTNSDALADRLRLLRQYGWQERYVSAISGWNSRLDEVQAAILRVKLPHLDAENQQRLALANIYDAELSSGSAALPQVLPERTHYYHLYVLRHARRDALRAWLSERNIGTSIQYPVPVHQQPAYTALVRQPLPVTEYIAGEILSVPMYPELLATEARVVAQAICEFDAI